MRSKHSSDEQLLALMDGELSAWTALRVRRHLGSCWECRARLTRLENTAHALAEARQHSRFLSASQVDSARRRFLATARPMPQSDSGSKRFGLWRHAAAVTFAGVLSLAAGVGVWRATVHEPAPTLVPVASPVRIAAPPLREAAPVATIPKAVASPPAVTPTEVRAEAAPVRSHLNEVAAWRVIHELGLCRGQNVKVESKGGELHLTGVVAAASGRDDLIARLKDAGVPVVSELQSLEELAGVNGGQSSHITAERVARGSAPGEALVYDWLKKQGTVDIHPRANEISNQSVLTADLAWTEAWAIRDITGRFGPLWSALDEPARASVLSMIRDHHRELQKLAKRQRQLLAGILPNVHAGISDLHSAADRWNSAIQQLFAPAEAVQMPAAELIQHVAAAIGSIETMGSDDAALTALLQVGESSTVAASAGRER